MQHDQPNDLAEAADTVQILKQLSPWLVRELVVDHVLAVSLFRIVIDDGWWSNNDDG